MHYVYNLQNIYPLLHIAIPDRLHRAIPEIMIYFTEAFGNGTRIDYGTGHGMAFIMFLCCLFKIGLCEEHDKAPIVCKVFTRYLPNLDIETILHV